VTIFSDFRFPTSDFLFFGARMAKDARLSALLLDFGCVISKSIFENMELVERGLGLAPGTMAWRGPLDPAGDPLWRHMQADRITERQYWAMRSAEVAELVGETWEAYGLQARASKICGAAWFRTEIVDLLDDARAAGIRTGVLTNELALFHSEEWLASVPALKRIDAIVDATFTKVLKPDPRAYEMALESLRARAEETLFVDDQLRNVRGAEAAGLHGLHFDVRRPTDTIAQIRARLGLARGSQRGQ
jgi:putative hydrolase of the HAD superfamily